MVGAAQTDEDADDAEDPVTDIDDVEELDDLDEFDPDPDEMEDLEPDENLGPEPLGEDGPNTREAFEDEDDDPLLDEE